LLAVVTVLFAVVGLTKLDGPSTELLVGIRLGLALALSSVSTVAWMREYRRDSR
jgi:hypothetical protein